MAQKYIHYFGNESSESLLEAYGIVTKNNIPIDILNPKICPNCNEGNTQDAKFCAKCKMVLTYDAYNETLEAQKQQQQKAITTENQINAILEKMKLIEEEQKKVRAMQLEMQKFRTSITNSTSPEEIQKRIEAIVQDSSFASSEPYNNLIYK
jgi:CRISPR/Cas system CMR subunit Cmr4 (Cas7 group RAMP superfamily)